MKRRARLLLAAILLVGVSACGGPQGPPATASEGADTSATGDVQAFVAAMQVASNDYEPAESPAALALDSDLVVVGTIAGVQRGQSYAPLPGVNPEVVTSVLEIEVSDVVAGDESLVLDGAVFVQIEHPAMIGTGDGATGEGGGGWVSFDLSAFAATVPVGVSGAFFLTDVTREPLWDTVIDEGAGRPSGAPLLAAQVQGFLLEGPDGALVSVNEGLQNMPAAWRALTSLSDVRVAVLDDSSVG